MSPAQKKAQANFKKAIEYRKKTGCSLKQAFAHVKGSKVKTPTIKKKVAKKKIGVIKKKAIKKAVKKVIRKKATLLHKDTKSHNVNIRVVSGIDSKALSNVNYLFNEISRSKDQYEGLKHKKKEQGKNFTQTLLLSRYPNYIRSLKKQLTEAKKHIK